MRNSDTQLSNIPAVSCFFCYPAIPPAGPKPPQLRLSQPLHEESVKTPAFPLLFQTPAWHFILTLLWTSY